MPSNHLQLSHERTFMKGLVLLAILGLGAASATQTVTATVVHPAASAPCGNGPTTELFANAKNIVPAAALFGAFVVSKLPTTGTVLKPTSTTTTDDIRTYVVHAVGRVAKNFNKTWTDQQQAAIADQYFDTFTSGATATLADGDMLDVWAEHVQFTREYNTHLSSLGHQWRAMAPAKFKRSLAALAPVHHVQVAGKTFPLPGMAEVQTKQGWTDDQLDRAIIGYGQFLGAIVENAQRQPSERLPVTPSSVMDEVWHQHIRFADDYRPMCATVLQGAVGRGRYIHHAPFITAEDWATGPSNYQNAMKLMSDAGEQLDPWVWETASEGCLDPNCSGDCYGVFDCNGSNDD